MATRGRLMPTLLSNYFPVVMTLDDYLATILEVDATRPWTPYYPGDEEEYVEMMTESYVGSMASPTVLETTKLKICSPITDMKDVITQAQTLLFRRSLENTLLSGYKLTPQGVACRQANNVAAVLRGLEWRTLLQRVGADVMMHLLTDTSIFIPLPNHCLCQVTGPHLINIRLPVQFPELPSATRKSLKRPAENELQERASKRPRVIPQKSIGRGYSKSAVQKKTIEKVPNQILFGRSRLFYGRPTLIPKTQVIICGFQPNHVLNRFYPCYPIGRADRLDCDTKKQDANARHLSKYVFPREYGLVSAFAFEAFARSSVTLPNFADREEAIKILGKTKTPKRLKDALGLLEKLIWRHSKCKYHILRDASCPTKIVDKMSINKDIILEMLSGQATQLRTQASEKSGTSLDSTGNSIQAIGLTEAQKETDHRPQILDYACPYVEVYRYVVLVTRAVIPQELWGSEKNFKLVRQHMKEYITARRFESLSLHRVLQGFSTTDCEWLAPPGDGSKQTRVTVSDSLKRRQLLEDFIFWFFDSFLMSLLKTAFYVTESASFRNRVIYFRQDDWKWLCSPLIDKLTSVTFEKISREDAKVAMSEGRMGFSFVRLLPKDSGVRPIVNLKRKSQRQLRGAFASERSINQILGAAFEILTYERRAQPHLLGASVTGKNEIYRKLKQFKMQLLEQKHGKMPKLYFVKVDVQACFDTIEQSKLLDILGEVITHETYTKQKYGNISMSGGRVNHKYVKKALPEDERPEFLDYATQMAASLHHTIFVDQGTGAYSNDKKQDIMKLLNSHITGNIVKIGDDYYRQMIGIPQGSVLSSILCAFFYGDMEKSFTRFTNDPRSVLLRLVDDYMFVTCDIQQAKGFLEMMNRGHPEYGCFISRDKTRTNFDFDEQIMNVVDTDYFLWCGLSIDMRDLSVSGDYARYHGAHLRDTLTVSKERRPGASFTNKMLQLAKAKSHAIFSDASLNSEHTVYLNVYQNFLLCAMKMHGYISECRMNTVKNASLIQDTVKQMIAYCFASLRSMGRNKVAEDNRYTSILNKEDVVFLGTHAFHVVLSRKPRLYASILWKIKAKLKVPGKRRTQRFGRLIKEGGKVFEHIFF